MVTFQSRPSLGGFAVQWHSQQAGKGQSQIIVEQGKGLCDHIQPSPLQHHLPPAPRFQSCQFAFSLPALTPKARRGSARPVQSLPMGISGVQNPSILSVTYNTWSRYRQDNEQRQIKTRWQVFFLVSSCCGLSPSASV